MSLIKILSRGLGTGVGGKVLQVSSIASTSGSQAIATTTYTDVTGLSLSITPSSTSSKILLVSNINSGLGSDKGIGLRFLRGATNIYTTTQNYAIYSQTVTVYLTSPFVYLDSPSTTSATTYKVQCSAYNNSSITFNISMESTFYLMEIAG